MTKLTVTETAEQAVATTVERLRDAIEGSADTVHIALAGGNTPKPVYTALSEQVSDWSSVELWLGDERMVSADDPESNLRMVREAFGPDSDPAKLVHPVQTELPAEEAAKAYGQLLKERCPALTVALLGLGEDAHTASLFPNDDKVLDEPKHRCMAVHHAPKPPPDRITTTLPLLREAGQIIVLATGPGKADAVAAALAEPSHSVPASLLPREKLELIVDEPAADAIPAGLRT